jgi:hypothetical protein
MPVEINVRFADGSDTTFRVMNDVNNQSFYWIVDKQPVVVFFDPDRQIVLKNASTIVGTGHETSLQNQVSLQVMPNPASEKVTIYYNIPYSGRTVIQLTNLQGDVVLPVTDKYESQGSHQLSADCSKLSAGTYVCSVITEANVTHAKVVIVK